jgi:hypothetical protein
MFSTNSVERMRIASNGNVGIGTSTPQDAFHIFNTTNTVGTMRLQGGNTYAGFIGVWEGDQSLLLTNNRHPGTGNNYNTTRIGAQLSLWGGDIHFYTTTSGTVGTATELMRIKANGNVGIGTATPIFSLEVSNSDRLNPAINVMSSTHATSERASIGFGVNAAVTQGWAFGQDRHADGTRDMYLFDVSNNRDVMYWNPNGNVGIGTTNPANHKLDVVGEIRASGGFRFADGTLQTTAANLTALNASNLASGTVPIARLGSGTADSTKFLRGDNTWAVPSGTSQWTTSGTIISYNSGNVGVGTASPTEKLEVIGNIKVSGNINAKYQDVAEWVDSSQELAAGTVVVLDSSRSNHVIAATKSYDSRIAGVISLQPGLTLGEEAEGRVLVATTGRVRVKVDATKAPIQIGDLLVTSNREGLAMKSLPVDVGGVRMHRPGTLIGKALEPLTKGTGEILVLLSLQ